MADIFDAEHLVNLEKNEDSGVTGPEQAIICLHQLHASKVLQPAKIHLRLGSSHLSIINKETDQEVEKFSYPEVEAHEKLFVRSVSDRHKNLLLLTVIDSFAIVPPEFFILQFSSSTPVAKEFLEKFKAMKKNHNNSTASSLHPSPSSEHVFKLNDFQAKQAAQATMKYKGPKPYNAIDMCLYGEIQQQPQQSQQLLNKYMELLNRCLDDVEAFVTRLKVAASNYQELEGWREEKKYGAHGGGIRMMRSQPPPPQEFYYIFQKIKLAFNILTKLKGHIKSPNAPELVHFLFNPLDLIVEASCAVLASNEEPIWEQTLTPLLNADTIHFFDDSLLSNEADLHRSLGAAWNIPSSDSNFWLSYVLEVPAYKPVFADSWSPSDDVMTHISIPIQSSSKRIPTLFPSSQPKNSFPQQQQPVLLQPPQQQQQPFQQLQLPQQQQQQPLQQLQLPQQPEIHLNNFNTTKKLEARPSDLPLEQNLLRANNAKKKDSFIRRSGISPTSEKSNSPIRPLPISPMVRVPPHSPQSQTSDHSRNSIVQDDFVNSILSKGSMAYITTEDNISSNVQELDAKKGEAFEVLESKRLHSKVRASSGLIGYVPSSILQPLNQMSENQKIEIGLSKRRGLTPMDHLNKEFQNMMTQPQEVSKAKKDLSPALFINEKSSPQDVTAWLASKGFDESVQESLASFGGKQLFLIGKKKLEGMFGIEVGGRLNSQILVQRNTSGYKSMRGNELSRLLESRKKKANQLENNNQLSSLFSPVSDPKTTEF